MAFEENLTLVAYYDRKTEGFSGLVDELQHRLASLLGDHFTPYERKQVHATIIGLEGVRDGNRVLNKNYLRLRQKARFMDFKSVNEAIDHVLEHLPIQIRFGGIKQGGHYPFTSRGEHPFARSFVIYDGIAVGIGWPIQGSEFPPTLERLRRGFNKANVLHKYHRSDPDSDNDFFFVLGRVDSRKLDARSMDSAVCDIRNFLELRDPVRCELRGEHLSLVSYRDPSLPRDSSNAYEVTDIRSRIGGLRLMFHDAGSKR